MREDFSLFEKVSHWGILKNMGKLIFFSQKQRLQEEVVHRNQYNAGDTSETAKGTNRASHICIPCPISCFNKKEQLIGQETCVFGLNIKKKK